MQPRIGALVVCDRIGNEISPSPIGGDSGVMETLVATHPKGAAG
ncbi:MAG TPA: hypothetical protein VJ256_06810 [Dehalococcoidia bacterium]|nr:hypothetical protein [Dehalococcoidia bacterium]